MPPHRPLADRTEPGRAEPGRAEPGRADAGRATHRARGRRLVASLVAATLALAGAMTVVTGPWARPAAAATRPGCPAPGEMPGIGNLPPQFTDSNVAVFAGGDFVATGGAAESEGLHVVRGDARFETRPRTFNLGTVGVGSQIAPSWGHLMLQVGGDVRIADGVTVSVGFGQAARGGAVNVGGAVVGAGTLDTNTGALTTRMGADAALAPWQNFPQVMADTSAALAAVPATGTTRTQYGFRMFLESTEPDNTTLQAFTLDAADLDDIRELRFEGIPQNAPIVVNVVGDDAVRIESNFLSLNGEQANTHETLGNAASQILWNFVSTTSFTRAGTSEWVGSVLAPHADVDLHSSSNGRVLAGGNLTTRGDGHELHSFPWIGPGPFDCVDGSFAAQKTVVGETAAAVPGTTTFELTYSFSADGTTTSGTLHLPVSGALVSGPRLPAGTEVTITETNLPELPGIEWGDPVLVVDGIAHGNPAQFEIAEDTIVRVVVVNTANTPDDDGYYASPPDRDRDDDDAEDDDAAADDEAGAGYETEGDGETDDDTIGDDTDADHGTESDDDASGEDETDAGDEAEDEDDKNDGDDGTSYDDAGDDDANDADDETSDTSDDAGDDATNDDTGDDAGPETNDATETDDDDASDDESGGEVDVKTEDDAREGILAATGGRLRGSRPEAILATVFAPLLLGAGVALVVRVRRAS